MALTGETKYKILYNTFLTNTKNYSEFINTGFIDLYTQKGHGILEESFRYVSYEWGNIMNTNPNLVGFPNDSLQRLDDKYVELKNSITAQTTGIQQELPFGTNTDDREYVKKVLLKHVKSSWVDLRGLFLEFLIELRDRQVQLTNSIDKLNLISSGVGGYLTGSSNNGLVSFLQVSATSKILEVFCSNAYGSLTPEYTNKLSYSNEYLFFIDRLMDEQIIRYMDSHMHYGDAEKLVSFRSNKLIKDLTKARTKYGEGIKKEIVDSYKTNLLKFAITLLNYDTKKYKNYFDKTKLPSKLKQVKSIPKAVDSFEVNFTQSNSDLSLVRGFFDSTTMGTNNSSYNLKIIKNISIT